MSVLLSVIHNVVSPRRHFIRGPFIINKCNVNLTNNNLYCNKRRFDLTDNTAIPITLFKNRKKNKGYLKEFRGAMALTEQVSLQCPLEDGQGFCCPDYSRTSFHL